MKGIGTCLSFQKEIEKEKKKRDKEKENSSDGEGSDCYYFLIGNVLLPYVRCIFSPFLFIHMGGRRKKEERSRVNHIPIFHYPCNFIFIFMLTASHSYTQKNSIQIFFRSTQRK